MLKDVILICSTQHYIQIFYYNKGNARLYKFTKGKDQEMRADLLDFNNNTAYAQYSTFYIGDEKSNYTLTVSGSSGTAGTSVFYTLF